MYKFVKNITVKNFYRLILPIFIIFIGTDGIQGQVTSGDFQYATSVSAGLQSPARMAIDHNDNIYVTDVYAKNIKKYDPAGNLISTIVIDGSPLSVAVNSNNILFVGDAVTGNILKINSNGTSSIFYSGTVFPNSMTFSQDNHLYIADSKLRKVLVLNASGQFVQSIGEGTLIFPTGINYDQKNNRIIVGEHGADNDNLQTRVYIYALNGTLINMLGLYGNGNGKFYRVQGVTAGRCGNIYVCEPFQGNISVFNESGIFITKFGEFGLNPGQLNIPMDIAFDSQERIWISSMNNGKLEVYTINDPSPSASINSGDASICEGQSADILIKLTGTSPWNLTYTVNGQNPAVINNITTNPYHLVVSQPGTYVVTALSDATMPGTCFSGSATVTINPPPTAEITPGINSICQGQTFEIPIHFTGTGPWNITYTNNGTNPVTLNEITSNPYLLEVSEPGTYEISSVASPQCTGTVLPGNAVITVKPVPTAQMESTVDSICNGDQLSIPVYFSGTPPWNFDYTINNMNPVTVITNNNPYILTVSDPGYYEISALGDANCSSNNFSGTVIITVSPKPLPDFTYLTNNLTLSLFNNSENASYYHWSFGDNTSSTLVNPIHTYNHAGVYTVRLGCWNEICRAYIMTKTVSVSKSSDTAAIFNSHYEKSSFAAVGDFSVDVYPNPSRGQFTYEINNIAKPDINVEITNITGQMIFQKSYSITFQSLSEGFYADYVDLSDFPDGIYTMKVVSGEAVKTSKLVLNK